MSNALRAALYTLLTMVSMFSFIALSYLYPFAIGVFVVCLLLCVMAFVIYQLYRKHLD